VSRGRPGRRRARRNPIRVADRLDRLVSRRGAGADTGIGRLRDAWAGVVGAEVARVSHPQRRSRAGVLTVACADATWAQELSARHDELVERLRRDVAEVTVTRLRFAVSTGAAPPSVDAPEKQRTLRTPSPADRARAKALVASVDDPRLREVLSRAAAYVTDRHESH
jgi:predicted nucleic acid-binding Zn ribbon protein